MKRERTVRTREGRGERGEERARPWATYLAGALQKKRRETLTNETATLDRRSIGVLQEL